MGSIRDRASRSTRVTERLHVPEWDVDVEIRSITVKQHSELVRTAADGELVDMGVMVPRLLVLSVFDPETGEPAFTDEDVEMLTDLPAGVVERLGFVAMRVSGIDKDALESGKGGS